MTKPYKETLPHSFPNAVSVPGDRLAVYVAKLITPNSRFPNGSSFAVTVDNQEGYCWLWMSDASFERVKELDL
jgi:hypothetical protein